TAGGSDIFVAKYNGAGQHQWSKRVGGDSTDNGYALAVDSTGNVVVTGLFAGTVDFGGGPLPSAGLSDIFLAKYSAANGSHMWSKTFGSSSSGEAGHGVEVDGNNDVLLVGKFSGTTNFGGGLVTSAGNSDVFVAKYRGADGGHVWSKRFGSLNVDTGYSIGRDGANNV